MASVTAISNGLAVFGAPDISIVDRDMGFIGKIFQYFSPSRNIVLQAAIHGSRKSLGAKERRRGHSRAITDHIVGNRKTNCLARKEWEESTSMKMMHLNSNVQQLDGFAPGKRVFGRTPKIPIGASGGPHFRISRIQRSRPRPKRITYLG